MKKIILLTIVLSTLALCSCQKDSITKLAGTTWKSLDVDYPESQEYFLLKFHDTSFDLWFKIYDEPLIKDSEGTYIALDNEVTLTSKYYNLEADIVKNKMVFSKDGKLRTFTKN